MPCRWPRFSRLPRFPQHNGTFGTAAPQTVPHAFTQRNRARFPRGRWRGDLRLGREDAPVLRRRHQRLPSMAASAGRHAARNAGFVRAGHGRRPFRRRKGRPPPQTEIVRSPSNALSREAMRVIDTSPAWETGPVGERPVRVRMYVSFRFRVEKPAPPSPQVPAAIIPDTVAESIPATHSASDVTMLTFRGGGMEKFREWFMDELEYSVGAYQRDLTGRSSIQFVVGKDDSLEASPCWKRRTKCSAKQ